MVIRWRARLEVSCGSNSAASAGRATTRVPPVRGPAPGLLGAGARPAGFAAGDGEADGEAPGDGLAAGDATTAGAAADGVAAPFAGGCALGGAAGVPAWGGGL